MGVNWNIQVKYLKNRKILNFFSTLPYVCSINKSGLPLTCIFYTLQSNGIFDYVLHETSNCFLLELCLLEASAAEFRPRLPASCFSASAHALFHRSSFPSTVWQRRSLVQRWKGSRHAPSAAPSTSGAAAAASEAEELDSEDAEVLSHVWYWCWGLLCWPLPAPGETEVRKLKCAKMRYLVV